MLKSKLAEFEGMVFDPSLRLYLPLSHIDGGSVRSRDAYGALLTPSGCYWTPNGWFFDGTDDEIVGAAAVTEHLNFTSEDFSVVAHLRYNDNADTQYVCGRLQWNTSGWGYFISNVGHVQAYTFQAGATQESNALAAMVDGQLATVGFSRQGSSLRIYVDGVDITNLAGSHTDPDTASRDLGIGSNAYGGSFHKGLIKVVAVWARWLSPSEHSHLHQLAAEVFP